MVRRVVNSPPRRRGLAPPELAAALLLGACGQALPSPAVVDKLRLLTLVADPPEVLTGSAFHVSAVWYDGSPRVGRPVYFQWRICAAGNDTDARRCLARTNGIDLGGATAGGDQVTIGAGDLPPAIATANVGVDRYTLLVAMCPVSAPVFDVASGQYACPSESGIPDDQREGITGSRLLTVRAAPPLNHNPGMSHVLVDEREALAPQSITVDHCPAAGSAVPCTGVALTIFPTADAAETTDSGAPETLLASFFVTAGSVDRPRSVASPDNPTANDGALRVIWFPPTSASTATVWFALHDGRGGNSIRSTLVTVR